MAASLFTIPKTIIFQFTSVASGAKANFYITGTVTRQSTFTDKALTIAHDNPVVADAFGVFPTIYLDDTLNYKVDITDSANLSLTGYPIDDLASNETLVSDLASTANALGASLIGIEDAAAGFTATGLEAVLAEIGPVTSGNFTATWTTGFTTSPTTNMFWRHFGNFVMMHAQSSLAGTSDVATCTTAAGDIPAAIRPVSESFHPIMVEDNGTWQFGVIEVETTGQILLHANATGSGGFTTSGDKGFRGNTPFWYRTA